mmetsp:Transcript_47918/g.126394  ORF Transcript_47918/g.126394 Transcript_47918/m.126394 type:complete len:369 (-) Transcript_47918:168-1274(-)
MTTSTVASTPASASAGVTPRNIGTASSSSGVSSLDDPKGWRQQLERAQATLLEGGNNFEDNVRREKLLQKLREDMRRDIKRGYMIPADAMRSSSDHQHQHHKLQRSGTAGTVSAVSSRPGSASGCHPVSGCGGRGHAAVSRPGNEQGGRNLGRRTTLLGIGTPAPEPAAEDIVDTRSRRNTLLAAAGTGSVPDRLVQALITLRGTRSGEDEDPNDEEEDESPRALFSSGGVGRDCHPFDLDLLPPLNYASPRQKQLLMKDLERQARTARARRKFAMRRRVASIIQINRKTPSAAGSATPSAVGSAPPTPSASTVAALLASRPCGLEASSLAGGPASARAAAAAAAAVAAEPPPELSTRASLRGSLFLL